MKANQQTPIQRREIKPQAGFQYDFLSCPADIVVGGGAAGAGKTFALMLESLRNINNPDYGAVFFRRTFNQITAEGGLWDEASKLYPSCGGVPNNVKHRWNFPTGSKVSFSHLQYEKNLSDWQGTQIPLIVFDELTHFTKKMFTYLLSRNRSTCGVKPYMRATCNPDADSWVAQLIEWYIDKNGYIIPERSGKIRYFTVKDDDFIWGDSKQEVYNKSPHLHLMPDSYEHLIKSFAFIEGDIYENKELLSKDPGYLGNLMALSEEDQLRLLKKNWKIKIDKKVIFNYEKFCDIFGAKINTLNKGRFITADIATRGSDLLIIYAWEGKKVIDIEIVPNNDGRGAVEAIRTMQDKYDIRNENVCFDADGVGQGLTGFIDGAYEFMTNHSALNGENYKNIKAQCAFNVADCINQVNGKSEQDGYSISRDVLNRIFPFNSPSIYKGKTIEWILLHQMKAFKREKSDHDGKISLITKPEMKDILGGLSPDFFDAFIMREIFELTRDYDQEVETDADDLYNLY